ncbi:MAG: enoyl-CoA hydratase [Candidatus Binatia bacterium]|nr:MAG: enoyl-CoA hydratase [Candidatus Binatia bacterium]
MKYEVFTVEKDPGTRVATLWHDNAERRNAMGPAFWKELPLVMEELANDREVRAVVLAGRGRDFSVGLDLKTMMGTLEGGREALLEQILRLQRSISSVADCPKPVVAAVHGYCLGGGVDLATACDIRYASADAVFSIRETRMAMVADVGTLQRLPAIVGKGFVAELALTGDDIPASRAKEIHLVNEVFPDAESTLAAARSLAARIARNSPRAVTGTKRVLQFCEGKSVADGLRYVAVWNAAFLPSKDLEEAVRAFLEKREPEFTGE